MYASALAVSPRLHSSFSENMFSVTAHGMRVRGARACSTPINGMVPAPLASTHKNTWSAASRRYPRMRRVTGGNTTPRWSVDAPPTRPQRYGCAHTASKRTFTERYTRLTRGASLCPFCRLLRVYSKLHDPISEIPPTRLPFGYAILTSPRITPSTVRCRARAPHASAPFLGNSACAIARNTSNVVFTFP